MARRFNITEPRAASPGQIDRSPDELADSEISLCNHATTLAQTGWSWRCAGKDLERVMGIEHK